ncbi:MAG TPA: CxxC-x17-CxxC domain-containing protein [Patescibacteria group bacterium]|nr:CxxC-x17-CxxC domain-containing protein [Patescibacteria group bacterium]
MKNFNQFGKTGGGPKKRFNKFNDGGSRAGKFQSDKQLHEATCESCGKTCGVPFKPNGKKPVYCSLCFKKGNHGESKGDYEKRDFQKPSFFKQESYRKEFDELNRKLDKIMKMLAEK